MRKTVDLFKKILFFGVAGAVVVAQTIVYLPSAQAVEEGEMPPDSCTLLGSEEVKTPIQLPDSVSKNGLSTYTSVDNTIGSFTAVLAAWNESDQGFLQFTFPENMDLTGYDSLELMVHASTTEGTVGDMPLSLQWYDNRWASGTSSIVWLDSTVLSEEDVSITIPITAFDADSFNSDSARHLFLRIPQTGKMSMDVSVSEMNFVSTQPVCLDEELDEEDSEVPIIDTSKTDDSEEDSDSTTSTEPMDETPSEDESSPELEEPSLVPIIPLPLICGPVETGAFTGCYYNNMDFTDLELVRSDAMIDMDVGMGSPDPAIDPETFSIEWKGNFMFNTGTYKFTAMTDDGMQVYIDGELLLDKYFDQPETTYTFMKDLTAGNHLIRVLYYEKGGEAVAKLSWEESVDLMITDTITTDQPTYVMGAPVEVTAMITSNQTLMGANIDLELYNSSDVMVDQQIVATDLMAGVPKEVVWNLSAPMTAGEYTVKLGVFASDWSALYHWDNEGAVFDVTTGGLTCGPAVNGAFRACYYDNQDFTNLKVVRTDAVINNDWGGGSPDPLVQPDTFSSHWKGNFTFDAAEYKFTAVTDDGMQVWVDGVLVLDKNFDQSATAYTFNKTLTAGSHLVEVKYYENGGDAVAKLSWEKVGVTPVCGIPGTESFTGCYYDNMDHTNLKVTRNDPIIDFNWGTGSPDPSIQPDTFSVEWKGNFAFTTGTYQFTAMTDDGMRVYIDGVLELDKYFDQSPNTYTFNKTLSAGNHLIRVVYYENGGGTVAKLSWENVTVVDDQIVVIQPTDGSTVSGVVEVKAYVEGRDLSDYTLGWRVGTNGYTPLINDPSGDYKHNYIDFSAWNWEADSMYDLEFQAKDLTDAVIDTETITVIH